MEKEVEIRMVERLAISGNDELMESSRDSRQMMREVAIRQLNYGYVVNVGCKSFAFETSEKLIENLIAYINNPDKVEEDWRRGTFLK
jgi:hypothetical protein